MVERRNHNPYVTGSIPVAATINVKLRLGVVCLRYHYLNSWDIHQNASWERQVRLIKDGKISLSLNLKLLRGGEVWHLVRLIT